MLCTIEYMYLLEGQDPLINEFNLPFLMAHARWFF